MVAMKLSCVYVLSLTLLPACSCLRLLVPRPTDSWSYRESTHRGSLRGSLRGVAEQSRGSFKRASRSGRGSSAQSVLKCPRVDPSEKLQTTPYVPQDASCLGKLPFNSNAVPWSRAWDANSSRAEQARDDWLREKLVFYEFNMKRGYRKLVFEKTDKRGYRPPDRVLLPRNDREGLFQLCKNIFPHGKPMLNDFDKSLPVCVLVVPQVKHGATPEYYALFWSDYNVERRMPNFVAYYNNGDADPRTVSRGAWLDLEGFPTKTSYRPGQVTPTPGSVCRDNARRDCACGEPVSSRGHLATFAHICNDGSCAHASNTYINSIPARQPFDGSIWNARERVNQQFAKTHQGLHIVKGPSVEFDGALLNEPHVKVPSMFWGAVYSPKKNTGTAWVCRNGNRQPDRYTDLFGVDGPVGALCADGLSYRQIGERVGFPIFPGPQDYMSNEEKARKNAKLFYSGGR